jgi:hypothetical protein
MKKFTECKKLLAVACLSGCALFIVNCSNAKSPTAASAEQSSQPTAWVSAPWTADVDVGNPDIAGSASPTKNLYVIYGSGNDIQGTNDQFHFVYKSTSGNATFTAYVSSIQYTHPWAKAGIMMRENLNGNARNVMVAVTPCQSGNPCNGVTSQYRSSTGGGTTWMNNTSGGYYLKITRTISGTSSTFKTYKSLDGSNWGSALQTVTMSNMGGSILVGMVCCSHQYRMLCQAGIQPISIP